MGTWKAWRGALLVQPAAPMAGCVFVGPLAGALSGEDGGSFRLIFGV